MDLWHPTMTIGDKTALINILTLFYRQLLKTNPSCDPIQELIKSLKITSPSELHWLYSYSMIAIALIDNNLADDSEIHKYGLKNGGEVITIVQKCIDSYLPF